MTLTRTGHEEKTLRRALPTLAATGLPVIAADGGSSPGFVKFLGALGFTVVQPSRPGLVRQVKAALREALRLPQPFILYTEPDKTPFFEGKLTVFLQRSRPGAKPGLVFAARDAASFSTFPEGQRWGETVTNRAAGLLLRKKADFCYGPILLSREAAETTLQAPEELDWGWRIWILARMIQAGHSVSAVEMDLPCPVEQRGENSRNDQIYRTKQLRQNLDGLFLGMKG